MILILLKYVDKVAVLDAGMKKEFKICTKLNLYKKRRCIDKFFNTNISDYLMKNIILINQCIVFC